MSRIPGVQFTESTLFQEASPIYPPINDPMPLYAPGWMSGAPEPTKAVDPGVALGSAPTWGSGTAYAVGAHVMYGSPAQEYVAIQAGTNHLPNGPAGWWSGTHLYSDCYAAGPDGAPGRWDVKDIIVTNASSTFVTWSLVKLPPATYKLQPGHILYRYSATPPGGNPQDVSLSVDAKFSSVFYYQPLQPGQTFHPSHFRVVVNAGESLWASVFPGYISPFATPNGPIVTMRLYGDILV
jgi:hypothetical protein